MSVLTAIPACFADSYADARARFHAAAAGAMTKTYDNPLPGPDGGLWRRIVCGLGRPPPAACS